MKPAALAMVFFLLLAASVASAETIIFFYDSEEGDFIGQGGTATWTHEDGAWVVRRNSGAGIQLNFHQDGGPSNWNLEFAGPDDLELTEQVYLDAQRFPFQDPGRPGMAVFGEGRACNTVEGEFTVSDVLYDWYGEPVRFSAAFEQHCEGAPPALFGTIDYDLEFGGLPISQDTIVLTLDNRVYEYTMAGDLVQVIPILESQGTPPLTTEVVRDLVVTEDGVLHVFNGTNTPVLSSGDPATETWEHHTFSGWNTANNATYGGIATRGSYIYVTDTGAESGIVRFDASAGYGAERFATGIDYIDLTLGLDSHLYALQSNETTIDVYDPATMSFVRDLDLEQDMRGIAVNQAGDIFGVPLGTTIYRFDLNGVVVDSLATTEFYADLDIAADGTLVAGGNDEAVVVTDEDLDAFTVFEVGAGFDSVFVALKPLPSTLFADGFESGDTSAWSDTVP